MEENRPGPDIVVHNPNGPDVVYSRLYRSSLALKPYNSPGLSPGWVDNYDLSLQYNPANQTLSLHYPNGAVENFMVGQNGVL